MSWIEIVVVMSLPVWLVVETVLDGLGSAARASARVIGIASREQ